MAQKYELLQETKLELGEIIKVPERLGKAVRVLRKGLRIVVDTSSGCAYMVPVHER